MENISEWVKISDTNWKSTRFSAIWGEGTLSIGAHGCCVKKIACSLDEVEEKLSKVSEYSGKDIPICEWKF